MTSQFAQRQPELAGQTVVLELAPVRVNLIAAGFVDTALTGATFDIDGGHQFIG